MNTPRLNPFQACRRNCSGCEACKTCKRSSLELAVCLSTLSYCSSSYKMAHLKKVTKTEPFLFLGYHILMMLKCVLNISCRILCSFSSNTLSFPNPLSILLHQSPAIQCHSVSVSVFASLASCQFLELRLVGEGACS